VLTVFDKAGRSDCLAFSLIIFMAIKSRTVGLRIPRTLKVIAEDATRYFLVIFTSHFVLTMTLAVGQVRAAVSVRSSLIVIVAWP
jgi:hypothetical protein